MRVDNFDKIPPEVVRFLQSVRRGSAPPGAFDALCESVNLIKVGIALEKDLNEKLGKIYCVDGTGFRQGDEGFSKQLRDQIERFESGSFGPRVKQLGIAGPLIAQDTDNSTVTLSPMLVERRARAKDDAKTSKWMPLPLSDCRKKLVVETDVGHYLSENAHPRYIPQLRTGFNRWKEQNPDIVLEYSEAINIAFSDLRSRSQFNHWSRW